MESQTGRVIVGVGRSPGAYQALRYAVAEARRRRVTLFAVRAFRPTADRSDTWADASFTHWPGLWGQASTACWRESGDASAKDALADAGAAVATVEIAFTEALGGVPDDVPVEIIAREGTAARTLASMDLHESDVLVIGGGGPGRLGRLRGAVIARFCTRRVVCPVVIVPPSSMARAAPPGRLARAAARAAADLLEREDPQSASRSG